MTAPADKRGKLRDIAALMPILGVLLFATPLIRILSSGSPDTLPWAFILIFGSWLALIILAGLLARRLCADGCDATAEGVGGSGDTD